MLCSFFAARLISSCGTPVGQSRRTTSAFFSVSESGEDRRSVLAEIAGGAGHFPFLIESARRRVRPLCRCALLLSFSAFEVDAHPVVSDWRLRCGARAAAPPSCVTIRSGLPFPRDVGDGNRARLRQLHGIEMHVFGDVGPAAGAEIAEQAQLAAAAVGFAGGDEIEPAVVVVIDRGNSPAALPAEIGQLHALEALPFHVAPQADAGRACVRESEIHPAVFVEVERDHADGGRQIFFLEIDRGASGVNFPSRGFR